MMVMVGRAAMGTWCTREHGRGVMGDASGGECAGRVEDGAYARARGMRSRSEGMGEGARHDWGKGMGAHCVGRLECVGAAPMGNGSISHGERGQQLARGAGG